MIFFDDEISFGWCLGVTWRCTPAEAAGLWSVVVFYTTIVSVTIVHGVVQHQTGTATRNEEATRRHTGTDAGDDWAALFSLLLYFFSFAAGSLLWALAGTRSVHPVQSWQLQLVGTAILVTCMILFVTAHLNMGANWSPEPEQKARHQLVTHGVFRWARHPIYAVFLWGAVGTLLASLNLVITWCVLGSVVMVLRRIDTEERILVALYGGQYLEYRRCVSALGPPWSCLGFDRDFAEAGDAHREYAMLCEG